MKNLLILMNCLGEEIENYFKHIPEINKDYNIKYIKTHENLTNRTILDDIKLSDIIITNNIKDYPLLTVKNIKKQKKSDCIVCVIEFIRFAGYFYFPYRRDHINFLYVYDKSTDSKDFNSFINCYISDVDIKLNYKNCLLKLKLLDQESDIKFYDFFINWHKKILLFRDNWHLTHDFIKYIIKQILLFLNIQTVISIDELTLEYTYGHKFRVKPILNCIKNTLGLEFNTDIVNIFNRNILIKEYYEFIQDAKICKNINETENLFNQRFNK